MKEWVLTKQSFDINFVSCVLSYRAENAWISQLEHSRPLSFIFTCTQPPCYQEGIKGTAFGIIKHYHIVFDRLDILSFFISQETIISTVAEETILRPVTSNVLFSRYFILGISFTRNSLLLLAKGLLVLQDSSPDSANPFWKLSWIAQVEFVSQIPCALLLFSTYYCITIGELSVSILFTSPFPKPGVSAWHRKRCQDFISEFSY